MPAPGTPVTHTANNKGMSLFDNLMKHANVEQATLAATSKTSWSHLMTYPEGIKQNCYTVASQLQTKALTLDAYKFVDGETNVAIKTLARDIDMISETADKIKEKHKTYSGTAKTEAEIAACDAIHSEYLELHDRYQRTVPPNLLIVSERLMLLQSKIKAGEIQEITKKD